MSDQAVDRDTGAQVNPVGAVFGLVERRELGPGNPGQHARQGFEQGDMAAELGQHRRRFEPDIAAADHRDIAHAAVDLAHQLVAVGTGANRVDPGKVGALARKSARIAAGCPDQFAVCERAAVGQRQHFRDRIDRGDFGVQLEFDGLVGPELRRTDIEPVEGLFAREVFLRQRRTLIRRLGLAPDHRHGSGEASLAQHHARLGPGMACTDDDNIRSAHDSRFLPHLRVVATRLAKTLRASSGCDH